MIYNLQILRHETVTFRPHLTSEVSTMLLIANQTLSWNIRDLDEAAGLAFNTDEDTSTI